MVYDKEQGRYAPDEIPSILNKTIYTHYCIGGSSWNLGCLSNQDYDMSGENYVVVATTPITIHIPKVDDLKKKVIAALEEEKKKQQAEHFKKMFELQEKIDSLLALEYQPNSSKDNNETL